MQEYRQKTDTPSQINTPPGPDDSAAPPPRRSSPPLSPTEQRVYELLIQRMTERQVAEQLGRSHNTIHVHVRNIYRKLGIRARQELFDLPYQPPVAKPTIP